MQWDLGASGLGVLLAMSLAFGLLAELLAGRARSRWLWAVVALAYFACGLVISEVWFGWATEEELQPNYDGLSFDEVLLIGLLPVIACVLVARHRAGRRARPPAGRHRIRTPSRGSPRPGTR